MYKKVAIVVSLLIIMQHREAVIRVYFNPHWRAMMKQ